jgi:hypothetical protein
MARPVVMPGGGVSATHASPPPFQAGFKPPGKMAHGGKVKKYAAGGPIKAGPKTGEPHGAGKCKGMGSAKRGGGFSGVR